MLNFLGIGAQKAGTTWLYERLRTHPEIFFPHVKEISFWDSHYPESLKDPTHKKNLLWYRGLFNHWDAKNPMPGLLPAEIKALKPYQRSWFDQIMAALDNDQNKNNKSDKSTPPAALPPMKLGEISPTYCYFENAEILKAVRDFAPDLRLVYSVRHPYDRAWSSALMGLKRAELKPEEVSDQWFIDHFNSHLSLKYGDYTRAIESWLSVFPKEQLLILRFEDIPADPQAVLKRVCAHIGVRDADHFDRVEVEQLSEKVFAGSGTALRPSLLPTLEKIYAPKVKQLKEKFGIDYTDWQTSKSSGVA